MPILALAIAVIAVSTSAPLIHAAAPAPAMTVAAGRIALAALILWGLSGRKASAVTQLSRRQLLLVVIAGLLLALHFGVWISSLYFTSTASSVALVATQPIFAGVLGWMFLSDRVDGRAAIGILIAGAGCAVLAFGDLADESGRALIGDLLALGGSITAAAYLVVGRGLRRALPLLPYLAAVNSVAAFALIIAAIVMGAPLVGFGWTVYVAIVGCAVIPSIVGHTLLNYCVRRIPVHLVSLGILWEPIGASLLTWVVFAEQPPELAALGGAIILVGIAIGFVKKMPMPPARDQQDAPV